MINIIDYDMGNIGSIINILHSVGYDDVCVTQKSWELTDSDGIILPGVGAFDEGIRNLRKHGLYDAIIETCTQQETPILGICLGMQLLGDGSDEGEEKGLGLIKFHCKRLKNEKDLKVPHMGWEYVSINNREIGITRGLPEVQRYYFVHSYYVLCEHEEDVLMECDYGVKFAAAVGKGNIYGVQFHPEKSHNFGKRIFQNFIGVVQ